MCVNSATNNPPIVMTQQRRRSSASSVLSIQSLLSPVEEDMPVCSGTGKHTRTKTKRKRASPSQLAVLNRVFNQTYFPSTELRSELGKQLNMNPRTVQIWFQNKRQALRARDRGIRHKQQQLSHSQPVSPPLSPTSSKMVSLPPLRLTLGSPLSASSTLSSPSTIDPSTFH